MLILHPSTDEDPCKKSPCLNNAECVVIRNEAFCKCPQGYVGKVCERKSIIA